MFTDSGVGNVKDIAQARPVPGIVHQSDPLGAAPYIPAHLFIPQAYSAQAVASGRWA